MPGTENTQAACRKPGRARQVATVRAHFSRFGEGFKDKVRQALLNMKDKDLLASFPRESFVPATNADYQAIEDTAKAIGLID